MNTKSSRFEQLLANLQDKEYRDHFVDSTIRNTLAFQLRMTREARGWSQEDLGRAAGMAQETISRLENPNYGKFTISTLKRLASALDVALSVRFVPFTALAGWVTNIPQDSLAVRDFAHDMRQEGTASSLRRDNTIVLLSNVSLGGVTTNWSSEVVTDNVAPLAIFPHASTSPPLAAIISQNLGMRDIA